MKTLIDSNVTQDERAIRKTAFKAILDGGGINRDGLVLATGFSHEKVDALVAGLTTRGLLELEQESGRIVGSWGLSLTLTTHELRIRGRTLHTWCAEDAIGIPAGLGEDAGISSRCHECGIPVSIEMIGGRVVRVVPPKVLLWVTAETAGRSVVGFT